MKKINLNLVFVLVLIFAVLFVSGGSYLDNRIVHDFPFAYAASDSFVHLVTTEHTKDVENLKYYSFYTAFGHDDVYQSRPILLYQVSAVLSKLSNIPAYDSVYIVTLFNLVIIFLLVYVIIRRFSKKLAMLSIPFGLLMFTAPFREVLIFGQWYFIMGVMYMVALFWIVDLEIRKKYLLMGLLMAGSVLIHIPETFWFVFFIPVFFVIYYLKNKKLNKEFIKHIFISASLALIISSWFLFIFVNTEIVGASDDLEKNKLFTFTTETRMFARGFSDINLKTFGFYLIPIFAGLILFVLGRNKLNNKMAIIGMITILISFMVYLNFEKRAFSHRWFLYVYLCL